MKKNILQKVKEMEKSLPEGFALDWENAEKHENVYAVHISDITPPLVWRNKRWNSTALN